MSTGYSDEDLEGLREVSAMWDTEMGNIPRRLLATIAAFDEEVARLRALLTQGRVTLKARVDQLEAALRYYADPRTYETYEGEMVMDDMGNIGDGSFDLGATACAALLDGKDG